MIPFQRQVYEAHRARKAEMKEERMNEAQSGGSGPGGGRTKNSMSGGPGGGSGHSRSETVRYNSQDESGDEDTLEVIE